MLRLGIFFLLAYLISWGIWLPLYGPAFNITDLTVLPYHHALGAFGPMIAAFITSLIFEQKNAGTLLRSMFSIGNTAMLIVAFFSPFLLALASLFIGSLIDNTAFDSTGLLHSKEFPSWSIVAFTLYNILTFGFGEEVGWRGFALPHLQKYFHPLLASVILTVFWAGWHIPLFFYRPGYVNMNLSGILGWLASLLTGSILLTWFYNNSRGSLLVCAVFHATIDVAFTANYQSSNIIGYLGFMVTVWGILVSVLLLRRNQPVIKNNTGY